MGLLRYRADAILIALSIAHGLLLPTVPSVPLVALGLWWNANTIAHNFLHQPFFRSRSANRAYSAYLSVVLGVPQSLWRRRHLAHHADKPVPLRIDSALATETVLVLAVWMTMLAVSPEVFWWVYLPGWAIGLGLCQLQGHYEHAWGTTSHYGRFYNWLFFNDGYHVEHHASPATHWTRVAARRDQTARSSAWPAVLRWLDHLSLAGLERVVLVSPWLQRWVLDAHERAFREVLGFGSGRSSGGGQGLEPLAPIRIVTIVGGGLFPRTAIVIARLFPAARLLVVERNTSHIERAKAMVGESVTFVHAVYDPRAHGRTDLLIVPLAYDGDREQFYREPPGAPVVVHDWIWAVRGRGAVVSWLLAKRVNLVMPAASRAVRTRAS